MQREIRLVEWIDAEGGSRWQPEEFYTDAHVAHCVSVGFVMSEDRERIVLCQSLDAGNATADNHIVIPAFSVTRQVTLRRAKA